MSHVSVDDHLTNAPSTSFTSSSPVRILAFRVRYLGTHSDIEGELGLSGPDYFNYLNSSRCYQVDGIDDKAEFQDTMV